MFSDEATFHKNGFVNRHNFHYYSDHNPRIFRQIDKQHRWSINVWGGIIGGFVFGPHFFNGYLNGEMYLDFLQNELPRLCQNIPLATRNAMLLQHDGAPAHYSMQVRNHLNQAFGHRWIGRGGPTKWPPRSPDLTSLDFFYGVSLKKLFTRTLQPLLKICSKEYKMHLKKLPWYFEKSGKVFQYTPSFMLGRKWKTF